MSLDLRAGFFATSRRFVVGALASTSRTSAPWPASLDEGASTWALVGVDAAGAEPARSSSAVLRDNVEDVRYADLEGLDQAGGGTVQVRWLFSACSPPAVQALTNWPSGQRPARTEVTARERFQRKVAKCKGAKAQACLRVCCATLRAAATLNLSPDRWPDFWQAEQPMPDILIEGPIR